MISTFILLINEPPGSPYLLYNSILLMKTMDVALMADTFRCWMIQWGLLTQFKQCGYG